MKRMFVQLASGVFAITGLFHVIRLVLQISVMINGFAIPTWISFVIFALSLWLLTSTLNQSPNFALINACLFFGIGIAQFIRFFFDWEVLVGSFAIPVQASGAAFVLFFILGFMGLATLNTKAEDAS